MASAFDKRRNYRKEQSMSFDYSLSVLNFKTLQKVNSTGSTIDISDEGMGFYTDFQLEPGHILKIKSSSDSFRTAMVRWVAELEGRFRVGVYLYK